MIVVFCVDTSAQVKVLRKGIVTHLAVLITPWWFGMVDPVLSVGRAAEATFHLAFPPAKRDEVRHISALLLLRVRTSG